jgi:small subunit ribosomal protein S9
MATKAPVIWSTGKRKTAVARIRLIPGSGAIRINDRSLEDYFPRETARMQILEPFEITRTSGEYDVLANVAGGGVAAQACAVQLGIARALVKATDSLRPTLRKAGLLTRDPRKVERKKYGRHKARKRPQYSKR